MGMVNAMGRTYDQFKYLRPPAGRSPLCMPMTHGLLYPLDAAKTRRPQPSVTISAHQTRRFGFSHHALGRHALQFYIHHGCLCPPQCQPPFTSPLAMSCKASLTRLWRSGQLEPVVHRMVCPLGRTHSAACGLMNTWKTVRALNIVESGVESDMGRDE